KLIALERQQVHRHWIRGRHAKSPSQQPRIGAASQRRRHIRNERADQRSRRIAAPLTSPRIVHKEESQFAAWTDWSTQTAAENVLLNHRTRRSRLLQEIFIRVENGIAEELVYIAVKSLRARLQNRIDVSP